LSLAETVRITAFFARNRSDNLGNRSHRSATSLGKAPSRPGLPDLQVGHT
jgi:hypothetical protein